MVTHGRVVSQIDRAKDSKSSTTIVHSGIADHRATAAAKPVAEAGAGGLLKLALLPVMTDAEALIPKSLKPVTVLPFTIAFTAAIP
jgi:hypothetical protein